MTLTMGKLVRDKRIPLTLPTNSVSRTFAILAMRGAGKSNAEVVMAEQMYHAGLPWVAIDPKGDWWGIRSSADGKGAGLPIPIFGGLRGDVPLEVGSGSFMAELIFEHNLTCLLDVSQFSKGEQIKFLTDFAERLYRLHQANPQPRHIFMEEAEEYLPQRVPANMARCVGAWSKLIKLGRSFGLGATIATQRSASLNKDALTQVDTLIVLRTPAKWDRKAIEGWVEAHAISTELMESLPSLGDGEAWIWSPHVLQMVERVQLGRRTTFDSGATPEMGKARKVASLADVDLGAVRSKMAETIEKVRAMDPKALNARIRELEADLAETKTALDQVQDEKDHWYLKAQESADPVDRLVPFVPPAVRQMVESMSGVADRLMDESRGFLEWQSALTIVLDEVPTKVPEISRDDSRVSAPTTTYKEPTAPVRTTPPPPPPAPRPPRREPTGDEPKLGKAERSIISVLAQFGACSRNKLAFLAGYHPNSKGYTNAMSALRSADLITREFPASLTSAGNDVASTLDVEPLPRGRELLEHFKSMPKVDKAGRTILDVLYEKAPLSRTELAEACEYHPNSKGFSNALSRMRTLGFVVGREALEFSEDLREALR